MGNKRRESEGTSTAGGQLFTGYTTHVNTSEYSTPTPNLIKFLGISSVAILFTGLLSFIRGLSFLDYTILYLSAGIIIFLVYLHFSPLLN